MPLSWNEMRDRALTFSREWSTECSEDAEAKSFWDGFFNVSDFARFRLYDLDSSEQHDFTLIDLSKNVKLFGFIAGYQTRSFGQQDPVNVQAAEKLGKFHDLLKASGYDGHPLEVLLVRVLFCLFAEDTALFERCQFQDYLEQRTAEDGSDLGMHLAKLFQVLDTPAERRSTALDEQLATFPYVNGQLFSEALPISDCTRQMRDALLDCCALDWSRISPAIFGSLFQSIMDTAARRNLGAHYTSETNILKLIQPLFLDGLRAEFHKVKKNRNQLFEFLKKLSTLTFFDPACGCGNFLVIAYRELRLLELEVLRHVRQHDQLMLDIFQLIGVNVDQFHGIEIEEWPARIAEVALWLTDHQMNLKVSEEFGQYYARLPLKKAPHIVHGNALRLDWNEVIPAWRLSYLLGNPPFLGKHYQKKEQKAELVDIFTGIKAASDLDYVACWYRKAADYMDENPAIRAAYVSTNSIVQGEQVGILWPDLLRRGIRLHFAHRTFKWNSEARGKDYLVPDATLYHFGVLCSTAHMAWTRAVCGRLKSDYRYSGSLVYNNLPWPEPDTARQVSIEEAAQGVLDARAKFMVAPFDSAQGATSGLSGVEARTATLADRYDPLTMPPELVKAHKQLDRAVDTAYGKSSFATEAERVAFLFERYQQLTAPLALAAKPVRMGTKSP